MVRLYTTLRERIKFLLTKRRLLIDMKKYAVYTDWNYDGDPEECYEHCIIAPATKEDEEGNGENCISGSGRNGITFDVYNSLEEAILGANFKPEFMEFHNFTIEEIVKKNEILSHYIWNKEVGFQKKPKEEN